VPFDINAVKKFFLDKPAVANAVDAGTRRALSKFGAFVRTRSRSSIRKRKKASKPGQPPSSHVGTLKKLIFFTYDQQKKSVVIGPTKFAGSKFIGAKSGVPETLEYSGEVTIREAVKGATKARSKAQAKAYRRLLKERRLIAEPRQYTARTITVQQRPYMRPAFMAELPRAPQQFKDCIRSSRGA
jgi:hypothetical protein